MMNDVFDKEDYRLYRKIIVPEQAPQPAGFVSGKVSNFTSPLQGQDWAYRIRYSDIGKALYFIVDPDIQVWVGAELQSLQNGSQIHILRGGATSAVDIRPFDVDVTIINSGKIRWEYSAGILTKIDLNTWVLTGKIV